MYSEAFRCLYNAVKSSRGSSKVFICLDNCWNQKNAFTICYSARSTLESFAAKISDMQKDVNWNLAYHAYNQPLSDSQFWSGANASMFTSDANTTTFITMRNIQTLTDYVKIDLVPIQGSFFRNRDFLPLMEDRQIRRQQLHWPIIRLPAIQ